MTQGRKVNYLNNKDILSEIHKSKLSYCYIADENYSDPDIIVESVKKINKTNIKQAQINRASKMSRKAYDEAIAKGDWTKKPKQKEFAVDPNSIAVDSLVFRVSTYEHIPDEPGRKKTTKTVADSKAKVNFPPFKHYILDSNGINPREVVRSPEVDYIMDILVLTWQYYK